MRKEDSFSNLYKKMDATSKTRFHASRRLRMHAKFSTYTVVVLSLALILLSLMQAYELGKNIDSKAVGMIQVFAAVTVLVYSLLIEKNGFASASEKMYSCASRLGELKQKLYPKLGDPHEENEYRVHRDEYYAVLNLYETHANSDFRGDYIRAKLEMPEHYPLSGYKKAVAWCLVGCYYFFDFVSYPFVLGVLALVMLWVCFG